MDDVSEEYRLLLEERRANRATCVSMIASVIAIVVVLNLEVSRAWTGLFLVLGGLTAQGASNLSGLALLRPLARQERWASGLIRAAAIVVPIAIAAYVAGVVLLLIAGVGALWRLLVSS
ncbi:MAG: hypothetical protein WD069_08070 [Planctomycetales bacterium]